MNIPTELQFRDVRKQNKVIISKQQRQILPQNGTNFTMTSTGQQQIIFRLPNDENASIDFNSLWIAANVQVKGLAAAITTAAPNLSSPNLISNCVTAAANGAVTQRDPPINIPILALGDSIESIIARVAVYVNGSELERQDYYNQWESFSNMHTNNAGFANSLGSGAMLMNLDILEKSRQLLVECTAPDSNIIQVSFPLRYLGLSNLRSLVPSYLMGGGQSSIEIRIYLTSVTDCLTCGLVYAGTDVATAIQPLEKWVPTNQIPTIQLSEVRMNIDYVQTSEDYSSALREYLTANALTLPLKTYYQTQYQINANAGGWQNYTVSTQFSDIEAVFCVFFNSAEANNIAYLGSDRCHKPKSLIQARLSINGQVYPAVPISFNSGNKSYCGEAYQYLIKALFQNTSLEVIGNTNQKYVPINNNVVVLRNTTLTGNGTEANVGYINIFNGSAAGVPADHGLGNYESKVGSGYFYGVDKRYAKNITFTNPALANGVYTVNNHNVIVEPEIFWDSPTQFGIGFDVSKSSYNDEYTLSGADLSKTSGLIQVQLQFDGSDANAYNCLVVVQHKRLLEIGMDNSTIVY